MLLDIVIYFNIILSLFLVFLILINKGKSANSDVISSTSVNDIFGSKGSNSFLNKIIVLIALLLLFLNISINFLNPKILNKEVIPLVNINEYHSDLNSKEKI